MKKLKQNIFLLLLLLPTLANAQIIPNNGGLDEAADIAHLPKKSAAEMIGLIINAALSILGALFLTLIIIGGFRWMTAGGNSDKVGEAKKTISNSAIGLVIVVASYVIVNTVFERLNGQIGAGGAAGGSGGT